MGRGWSWLAIALVACGGGTSGGAGDGDAGADAERAGRCGNENLDDGESCDDGNVTSGDGCRADCLSTETCGNGQVDEEVDEACDDGNTRNGDGCSADCRSDETCGNGVVDLGAREVCDDGNTEDGDDCSADCKTNTGDPGVNVPKTTAFRITSLQLVDPHVFIETTLFTRQCRDVTDTPYLLFSVNGSMRDAIEDFALNYVNLFTPLDIASSTGTMTFIEASCEPGEPATCAVAENGRTKEAPIDQLGAGSTCHQAIVGTTRDAYPDPNVVTGPCFVTEPASFEVSVNGVLIPLTDARIAATYAEGLPPSRLVSGLISGFVPSTVAKSITLPQLGNDTLYEHLAVGDAPGGSCMKSHSDEDTYKGVKGFWFYLNFGAEVVSWSASL